MPAVIAKASAIHNPIIYAITHPKYRCGPPRGMEGLGLQLKAGLICLSGPSCVYQVGVMSAMGQLITLAMSAVGMSPSSPHKVSMAS